MTQSYLAVELKADKTASNNFDTVVILNKKFSCIFKKIKQESETPFWRKGIKPYNYIGEKQKC